MIRKVLCITWLLLLVGCADKPKSIKGAEAVIYPEIQRFDIKRKNNSDTVGEQQVTDIINDLLPVPSDTQWTISYRLKRDLKIAESAEKQLKSLGVIPAQIQVQRVLSLESDLSLEIKQYYLFTSTCSPYSFEQYRAESGCFVETLRMKQLVSPSSLIQVVKE